MVASGLPQPDDPTSASTEIDAGLDDRFDPLLDPLFGEVDEERGSYRRLHATYALVVFVLVATGLPIQFPDLRARLIGGYGRSIATVHEWAGAAMLVVPALVLVAAPRRALNTVAFLSYRTANLRLHAVNLWFTLIAGAGFVVSGFLLWAQASLPDSVLDASAGVHRGLSYVLYVMVPVHIIVGRKRTWEAVKSRFDRREGESRQDESGQRESR